MSQGKSQFYAATAFVSVLVIATLATGAEPTPLTRFARTEVHMAVDFEVVLYATNAKLADAALTKAMSRIAALDKALSDYDADSELSKLSASANAVQPVAVRLSNDLWTVLAQSQDLSVATGGAFDVTIGPLTKLWRRARRWKELPEAESLNASQAAVGHQHIKLDLAAKTATLLKPNMRLDLGGIAKGFAADEAVAAVKSCGISQVLVRASGDISAANPPPGQRGWQVAIAPLNPDDPPTRFAELANCGISTSGDARQHLVVDGRRYSHIIDPRTGAPVSGRSSVTVIAPRGMLADGLATAASVLGPDQALELIQKFPGTKLMMVSESDTGERQVVESSGFQ